MRKKRLLAAIFGVGACVFTASVLAAMSTAELPHQLVSFADLNLSSEQGAAALYSRIKAAAGNVCDLRTHTLDIKQWGYARACFRRAIAQAVRAVDRPELTRRYLAEAGAQRHSAKVRGISTAQPVEQ
jgi:UrcA family protein